MFPVCGVIFMPYGAFFRSFFFLFVYGNFFFCSYFSMVFMVHFSGFLFSVWFFGCGAFYFFIPRNLFYPLFINEK